MGFRICLFVCLFRGYRFWTQNKCRCGFYVFNLFLLYMHGCFACTYAHAPCVCNACRRQKRVSAPLGLESHTVVSHCMAAETHSTLGSLEDQPGLLTTEAPLQLWCLLFYIYIFLLSLCCRRGLCEEVRNPNQALFCFALFTFSQVRVAWESY